MPIKLFSSCWFSYLKQSFPLQVFEVLLSNIVNLILPNLIKPLLLADFLVYCYNLGGYMSLLALDGLFYLMKNNNLEYKNFYPKLYKLLTPVMLYTKIRKKNLILLNIFLSSSFLPQYMICSFAKKLSILALKSPTDMIDTLIVIISNLIYRYPNCKFLLQKVPELIKNDFFSEDYLRDSFFVKKDFEFSIISKFLLWEIKSLQRHYIPLISRICFSFNECSFLGNLEIKHKTLILQKYLKKTYISMIVQHLNNTKNFVTLECLKSDYLFEINSLFTRGWEV